MSNFFLCDMCDNKLSDVSALECVCKRRRDGRLSVEKRMMVDYGGANPFGVYGYLDTEEVCEFFDRRELT